jgi:hypothetical protein
MTITSVVKQDEGDKYPTGSLVLSLINSKRSGIHEDPFRGWFYESWSGHWKHVETISRVINPCLYPVSTQKLHIREDLKDWWVTNLTEDRKRCYFVATQLDPCTKMLSFCENKYFPSWKDTIPSGFFE